MDVDTKRIECMRSGSLSVTGATGFLGWNITDVFLRHGWDVRAVVRPGNLKSLPVRAKVIGVRSSPGQGLKLKR